MEQAADNPVQAHQKNTDTDTMTWERELVSRLASSAVREQRRTRRWGIFFKSMLLIYLFILLFIYLPDDWDSPTISISQHTALVDVQGVIDDGSDASADNIINSLRAAFESPGTVGVILRINSPGGSPVQAGYVNDEITRLRAVYPDTPLYAVVTDMCASGGYYIAAAADKIYADKASIVGSIGVLMDNFGFVEAMEKLGVERRLITAGESKGLLDPFLPVRPDDAAHIKNMLDDVHRQFIDTVKKGRGDRLVDSPELYSGLVWTGEQGLALGLVDGLGSSSYVAREIFKAEDIVNFSPRGDYLDRIVERFGVAMAKVLGSNLGLLPTHPTLR